MVNGERSEKSEKENSGQRNEHEWGSEGERKNFIARNRVHESWHFRGDLCKVAHLEGDLCKSAHLEVDLSICAHLQIKLSTIFQGLCGYGSKTPPSGLLRMSSPMKVYLIASFQLACSLFNRSALRRSAEGDRKALCILSAPIFFFLRDTFAIFCPNSYILGQKCLTLRTCKQSFHAYSRGFAVAPLTPSQPPF